MSRDKQIDNIERIIRNGEVLRMSNTQLAEALYDADYRKKSEVAEEIFGEIEKCRVVGLYGIHCYFKDDIAELKKKYIESEKDIDNT